MNPLAVTADLNELIWPKLNIPFAAHGNPHLERARLRTAQWAKEFALTGSTSSISRFAKLDPAWLAAHSNPGVGPMELELASAWVAWLFLFDDQGDEGSYGRDEAQWERLMGPFHSLLDEGFASGDAGPPLARALADLLVRSNDGMTTTWTGRFSGHVREYIDSYRREAAHRSQARPLRLADYLIHRRSSGAMHIVFDLAESLNHTEIDASIYLSREYQNLLAAASDVVCWDNDLASLRKELAQADVHNLVLVIMAATDCSVQDAVDRAAEMIQAQVDSFVASRRLMSQLLAGSQLPVEQQDHIWRCVDTYQHWIRANHDWPSHTIRYRQGGSSSGQLEPLILP